MNEIQHMPHTATTSPADGKGVATVYPLGAIPDHLPTWPSRLRRASAR
ncbi:hypothetical protein EP7_005572 (plasmid) [Isosphaeraceae bacterium EP7]